MPISFAKSDQEFIEQSKKLDNNKAGAEVSFLGKVRLIDQGKKVSFLSYEAHVELASILFSKLEEEAFARFGIFKSQAIHRVGRVDVGQSTVLIAVSAQHRQEAFLAARFLIDELKAKLPIWRKQHFLDGTSSFEACTHKTAKEGLSKDPIKKALLARGILCDLEPKKVLLVGAGGLGCPLAINLSSLCSITVYDGDIVEEKNLLRQFIYARSDIGRSKAELLKEFINQRTSCSIDARARFLVKAEALAIAQGFDLILDGSDCPSTKKMLKDVAHKKGVPLIVTSVYRSEGHVETFWPKENHACLSCFEPGSKVQACSETGVFTHACALTAALATDRALMVLAGLIKETEMLIIDASSLAIKRFLVNQDENCRVCSPEKKWLRIR